MHYPCVGISFPKQIDLLDIVETPRRNHRNIRVCPGEPHISDVTKKVDSDQINQPEGRRWSTAGC